MSKKLKGRIPGQFLWLGLGMLDTSAWRALTPGARCLYMSLKRRSSRDWENNGRIFLSQRDAATELGCNRQSIARWFRELEHYGFIVMTTPGSLGLDGRGKAPHWRLTEGRYKGEAETCDYKRWNGERFRDQPLSKQKQNPGTTMRARVAPLYKPVGGTKVVPLPEPTGTTMRAIREDPPGTTMRAISRSTISEEASVASEGGYVISSDPRAMEQWFAVGTGHYEISTDPRAMLPWSTPHIEEIAA